jgi:hypothetical protein
MLQCDLQIYYVILSINYQHILRFSAYTPQSSNHCPSSTLEII